MPGLFDYSSRHVLDHLTGKATFAGLTAYVGVYTAAPTDAGGGTEVSGGSYARVATSSATWNSASGSAPASTSNALTVTFPTATGNWGTLVAFALFDAATGGNPLVWDFLGNFAWLPFSCTLASPGVLTSPAHGYSNADQVTVTSEYGGTLPAGTWSGLLTVAGASTDTFNAGVNTTSTGGGMVRKVASQSVVAGVTPSFAAGALVITGA